MSKRLRIIFTLSIVLNIVFIGVALGMLCRFGEQMPPLPGDMSPQAKLFVERTFKEGREQIGPLIKDVKVERAKVEEILTAEPFDEKAYDAAVGKMLDAREKISRKRADVTGKALADLPVEERRKFADRILDGLEGKRPPKGGFHGRIMKGDIPPHGDKGDFGKPGADKDPANKPE